jgi:hypothetical protein
MLSIHNFQRGGLSILKKNYKPMNFKQIQFFLPMARNNSQNRGMSSMSIFNKNKYSIILEREKRK